MVLGITRRETLAAIGAVALAPAGLVAGKPAGKCRVEVFGHRGASALRPEHTLASYAKAIADGADFIEPDLVISKDGVLVVRHEPNIAETTDVAKHARFASRRTEKTIDGQKQLGWFVEDFTLAELRTLRAIERLPQLRPHNAAMDGRFALVTWHELIEWTARQVRAAGRPIGLAPELKHSTYFRSIGTALEDRFLASLDHAYARTCPMVIQSFEIANLQHLRIKLRPRSNLRLMQLIDPSRQPADVVATGGSLTSAQMILPAGLADIVRYADIIAPDTRSIIPLGPNKKLLAPSPVTGAAHAAGLKVMPYTFRPENYFLAADFQDASGPASRNSVGSVAEMRAYLKAGVDGFFTDDPALGRQAAKAA